MWVAKFSVRNPVLVNILMIFVIVIGAYSLLTIPHEIMPNVDFNWVFIITNYFGAGPEEIEKLITIPIEDEIADVDDIESITSESSEDASFISVKFKNISAEKFFRRLQDLKSEVDQVDLPEDAETPFVWDFDSSDFMPMISVVLHGERPEREMKKIADALRDDILDIKNVAKVELGGVRDREIWVEIDPNRLNGYHIALSQVIDALNAKNLNLTGGKVKIGRSEYVIRTKGEFDAAAEVENVIIRSNSQGGQIKIKDIAKVSDTFEEADVISRLNGEPAVTLSVSKRSQGSSIRIIDKIKEIVEEYRTTLPDDVEITLTGDTSNDIRDILHKLEMNAWMGMILVVAILYLFLGWRNALIVAIGIPVTFMFTFAFMRFTGRSLNGNSLFGLVMVLGIIVDDAIIIIENCYRYMQRGLPPIKAAVVGTKEVTFPVLATILTTIAAFLPLMLLPGIVGKFMRIVPIIVSLALVASLFEALIVLPSHFADWSRMPKNTRNNHSHIRFTRIRQIYSRLLTKMLRRRYWAVGGIVLVFLLSVGLIPFVGVEMFAGEEIPHFFIWITAPEGTSLEAMDKLVLQVENQARALPPSEVKNVISNTGLMQTETDWHFRPSVGQLIIVLEDEKKRDRSLDEIIADLRERTGNISGLTSIEFWKINTGPPVGKPVEVKVKGKYLDELVEVSEIVKEELRRMEGVYDIRDDFVEGKKELHIEVDEHKAALYNLSTSQIAVAVRYAFEGETATILRDGDEEVEVVVKFQESSQKQIDDIENMMILSPAGPLVPFRDVASIRVETGFASVRRFDRDRAITISADIDNKVTSSVEANRALIETFKDISDRYPGYRLDFGGEFQEFKEAFTNIGILFLIGIILIYMILGGQFRSFGQPLIILVAVPFAFIGAMISLIAGGYPISITVLYGVVALAGVAVNDALVLITFINNAREQGLSRWKSIKLAGVTRMRPVLLTSITTVCGLLPMAIGLGGKSADWAPLANTIVWGLAFATILTLFFIPAFYAIVDDILAWRKKDKDKVYRARYYRAQELKDKE
ncbi:MAG: efflux RND transporter permease subunit [Gemmatimonadota bacterium]|nr:MAG: efflux RND transporter permease subunit [Gemmatimonadota bacterium]